MQINHFIAPATILQNARKAGDDCFGLAQPEVTMVAEPVNLRGSKEQQVEISKGKEQPSEYSMRYNPPGPERKE
jgi:hypothetical protein